MREKNVTLRCKFCNGKLPVEYPKTQTVCSSCQQGWNIHWFQEDTALIISPTSWKEFTKRERELNQIVEKR